MALTHASFETPEALVAFVNNEAITAENIQTIFNKDNRWYLFYWA